MPTQQLLLSWKDHNGTLVSVFENLLNKNSLVDCTLAAEGQYLKAHKLVLSACSSYFELLFSQESEKNPIVILKDVKFQDLEAALNFMYRGEVEVCEDRLAAFLEVANSLQIKGLGSNEKSQDSKEKVPLVKSSIVKSDLTQRQESRRKDSNIRSDNIGQSSNVPANCEQIRNESSSVHHSSRRESSPSLTVSTFDVGSSSSVRKESLRDLESSQNIQQSLVLPSFTSVENVQSEETLDIKTEPETDIFLEEQSDEEEGYYGDELTMMDDEDDWNNPNTETMDVVPNNQPDIGYPSDHMKTGNSTSENVEGMQSGNRFSSKGGDWIEPDDQPNFSSTFVKEEPCTSASWNKETVAYDVSASGEGAGPSAGASEASSGLDSLLMEDNVQPTSGSEEISYQLPSEKFNCVICKRMFVRMMDLKSHVCFDSSNALPVVTEGELLSDDPPLTCPTNFRARHVKSTKSCSLKCSECEYVASYPSILKRHLLAHTGEKPYKCPHCQYVTSWKYNIKQHLCIHTGEKPFKCLHCGYASIYKAHLARHMRRH